MARDGKRTWSFTFRGSVLAATTVIISYFYNYAQKEELIRPIVPSRNDVGQCSAACAALTTALPNGVFNSSQSPFVSSVNSYWSLSACEVTPRCVVIPTDTADVSLAVQTLKREYDAQVSAGQVPLCEFAVSSGGHSPEAGFAKADAGVVIDLARLNQVVVSADRTSTVIGPGARWKDVSSKLDGLGLAVAGGRDSNVGVGGLILGGGLSFFSPRVGFVCSNIQSYEVVLANGTIAMASSTENPDLWRALKGGSNNFGVVTAFDANTFPSTKVWGGYLYFTIGKASQLLKAFNDFANAEDFDEFAAGPMLAFGYVRKIRMSLIASNVMYTKPEQWPKCWDGFKKIGRVWSTAKLRTLTDATEELHGAAPFGSRQILVTTTIKNDLDTLESAYALFQKNVNQIRGVDGIIWSLVFQPLPPATTCKGSVNSLGLGSRNASSLVILLITTSWPKAKDDAVVERVSRAVMNEIDAMAESKGTADPFRYLNYAMSGQDVFGGYGEENKRFLQETSRAYDPQGLFQRACAGGFKLGMDEHSI